MTRKLLTPTDMVQAIDADPDATPRERAMANALDSMIEYIKTRQGFGIYESIEHQIVHAVYPVES